jgi:hypothetical protein
MEFSKHPIDFIQTICKAQELEFTFSKYLYEADSLVDKRQTFVANSILVNEAWLNSIVSTLEPNEELALHSTVRLLPSRKLRHIPMIDFSIDYRQSDKIYWRLIKFIDKEILDNMAVYNSGRSLHAYSTTLITQKKWVKFMGQLLLVNEKGQEQMIDDRWIGHRLIGGFSALRWSNNSGIYISAPQKIKFP